MPITPIPAPKAVWHYEEASGARLDDSGNGHTQNTGSDTGVTNPGRAAGKHNFAAAFDGVHNGLQCPYAADFSLGVGQAWTATCWLYLNILPPSSGDNWFVAAKGTVFHSNIWFMRIANAGGTVTFDFNNRQVGGFGGGASITSSVVPAALTWYFLAWGIQADGKPFFKVNCNARQYGLQGVNSWTEPDTQKLTFGYAVDGNSFGAGYFLNGRVDEFYYWNEALSDVDLAILCPGGFFPFACAARFNLKLSGRMNGDMYSAGAYGAPTALILPDPVVGQVVILDVPVADVAGYVNGATGQTLIERVGDENCYAGDIAVSAIELYGDRAT